MERRLGRGLGSLLGQSQESEDVDEETEKGRAEGAVPPKGERARTQSITRSANSPDVGKGPDSAPVGRMIDVTLIRRNADQPRKTFDTSALEELRESVQRHGVLQPIVVRRVEGGYEVVSGERRWRAARSAGLAEIPAVVREDTSDDVSLELAIVENVQRQDLDALEKARGYDALMRRVGLTQEGVAERVGIQRSTVANHLRLLDLPGPAQEALVEGLISMGHARALLGMRGEKEIVEALEKVVREDLSVRETEVLVRTGGEASADVPRGGGGPSRAADARADMGRDEVQPAAPWVKEMEARIREVLGVKVSVKNGKGYRGSIVLDYSGREELERVCDSIAPKKSL